MNSQDDIRIAVTGLAWMGGEAGSVQKLIEDTILFAKDEIQIAAYTITEGASEFFSLIEQSLLRGIQLRLIVNRFDKQPAYSKSIIRKLCGEFPYFHAFDFNPKSPFEDLHAKLVIADRSRAVIGSSNLTWKGLVLNHELAVMVSGEPASTVADLFDKLARDSRTKELHIVSE